MKRRSQTGVEFQGKVNLRVLYLAAAAPGRNGLSLSGRGILRGGGGRNRIRNEKCSRSLQHVVGETISRKWFWCGRRCWPRLACGSGRRPTRNWAQAISNPCCRIVMIGVKWMATSCPGMASCFTRMYGQEEAVDDVFRREVDDDRPVHLHVELVEGDDVVLPGGVVGVEPEGLVERDEVDVAAAEDAVLAGVLDVPRELFGDHAEFQRVLRRPRGGQSSLIQIGIEKPTRRTTSMTATPGLEVGREVRASSRRSSPSGSAPARKRKRA